MLDKIAPIAIATLLGSALVVQQPRAAQAANKSDVKAALREVSDLLANSRGPSLTGTVRVEVTDFSPTELTIRKTIEDSTGAVAPPSFERVRLDQLSPGVFAREYQKVDGVPYVLLTLACAADAPPPRDVNGCIVTSGADEHRSFSTEFSMTADRAKQVMPLLKRAISAAREGFERGRAGARDDRDRIQLDGWRDPLTGQINPLTEIVQIRGNLKQGTGTFLAGCRLITAYHVLLAIRHPLDVDRLDQFLGGSLVGEWFEFETRPLPSTKQVASGRFVVLGHGNWAAEGPQVDADEDWAIGYDEECLSEKLKLGFVDITPTQGLGGMAGLPLFTAGHSMFSSAMRNGQLQLYVDARCGVSPEVETNLQQDDYLVTNCSVTHGGSGQLLLERTLSKGQRITGPNGRPKLSAYGIFQAAVPGVDTGAPNLENESMGVAPFTKSLRERIEPFLLAEPFHDLQELLAKVVSFGFEPAANDGVRQEAAFRIVPGLAGRCASLEWTNTPNHFLRHRDGQLSLERRSGQRRFEREATFCLTQGLADPTGVSFEALSVPNHFIRYRDSALWLDRRDGSDPFKRDATFESAPRAIERPVSKADR